MIRPHPLPLVAISLLVGMALERSLGSPATPPDGPATQATVEMPASAPGGPARPPHTSDFAVPVLMYHRIAELPKEAGQLLRDLTVSPDNFAIQMRYLADQGYAILTGSEVHTAVRLGEPLPEQAVAITLDDGYDCQFDQAFPILRRHGLDGTLFLVSETVSTPRHVTWDQARRMTRAGMDVGSHSAHHYDLTTLSGSQLDAELLDSKETLERELGIGIVQIAYPAGEYNSRVKRQARHAGYLAGWKKGGGWVTPASDPFMLPRVRVRGSTTMARFIQKITRRPATDEELERYGP